MDRPFRIIFGEATIIFGCCALTFSCPPWVEWGGRNSGGWFSDVEFYGVARDMGIAMAISIAIGVGAIALELRLVHTNRTQK